MDVLTELNRGIEQLLGRAGGPLHFRLILQPMVATILAIRAGVRDAHEGQPVFFWTLLTNPAERKRLAQSGWQDIGKIFIVALVLDAVYQVMVFHTVYPVQSLIVAVMIALLPYVLLRGLVTRIVRVFSGPGQPRETHAH